MNSRSQKRQQFTKQLRVMLASGVPLVNALELLSKDDDPGWSKVVGGISQLLVQGHTFSNALSRYPNEFPDYYTGSIASAEMSGQISSTLQFLDEWLEREADLKARVKKALTYPALVMGLSLVMVLVLFNTVIPKLMESFSSDLYESSWPTQVLTLLTRMLSGPFFYFLLVVVGFAAVSLYRREVYRQRLSILLHSLPVLGPLLGNVAALRFISSFALMLESGRPLLATLKASYRATGTPVLLRDEPRVINGVSAGESLSELWSHRPQLYPNVMVQMAMLGETASSLSDAMRATIPYLEMETYSRLDRFVEYIEPLLISGVALFIGFVAVAVILPISQITANL
ncbi:MAG: type II secretion system F family protein [Vulcanimicrobiota bacterium]